MSPNLNLRGWLEYLKPMPTGRGMIIVAGMQKSGTTAIAKLLGAAAGESVCSDPFHRLHERGVDFSKELYEDRVPLRTLWRRHRRVFAGRIVKDPDFSLLLPQIKDMLPQARIVFIVRDPRDTIRSILNRLGLPGNPLRLEIELNDLPGTWPKILQGKEPEIPGEDYVEVLAWRWRMCAEALLRYRNFCTEVRYEDFNRNKCEFISQLARQLGYTDLSVIDHLVDIQYQPKGNSNVNWVDFFGEQSLAAINGITCPVAAEFGYEEC